MIENPRTQRQAHGSGKLSEGVDPRKSDHRPGRGSVCVFTKGNAMTERKQEVAPALMPGAPSFVCYGEPTGPQRSCTFETQDRAEAGKHYETTAHHLSEVHERDEDCTVDPKTDCCTACGVYHGDPCPECKGRGFHKAGCPINEEGLSDDRPQEYAEADPLCCAYKTCGHGCEEEDPCSACAGRGDCGRGDQVRPGAEVAR